MKSPHFQGAEVVLASADLQAFAATDQATKKDPLPKWEGVFR
jgi:hypothetical protein